MSTVGEADSPPVPFDFQRAADVSAATTPAPTSTAVGVPVGPSGEVVGPAPVNRQLLETARFGGAVGETLVVPGDDSAWIIYGTGEIADFDHRAARTAGAAVGRASTGHAAVAIMAPPDGDTRTTAAALVEGLVLSRYQYEWLRSDPSWDALDEVVVVADDADLAKAGAGAARGAALASATSLARDLANTPHSHLSAARIATLAETMGASLGFEVEVFGKDELVAMGCGGLLGVNAGSDAPPRMVKMIYRPEGEATGHLSLVGKGIMYDSGGLSIKPGDEVHAQMKNDMSGAAAVLAMFSQLSATSCPTAVTAFLMCTDNMPSGTAMALGDVITIRGGSTVEVVNTDAEGRLVMADAIVLAQEEPTDAVVDIATLTGACMRALGTTVAGVLGSNDDLVAQLIDAGARSDEPLWRLPLEPAYRSQLDSTVADLKNLGSANAGAITAGLFLQHFVDGTPWAHVDIAGTAQSTGDAGWHTAGCTGFGARLLLDAALGFTPPTDSVA